MSIERDSIPGFVLSLAERYNLAFVEAPESMAGEQAERECNLLLAALHEVREELAGNQRAYADELQRAALWLERNNRGPKEREAWLLRMLEVVAPFVPRYGDRKSRDLPHGEIAWRTVPEHLEIVDDAAALAYSRAKGIPVKEVEAPYVSEIAKVWKEERRKDRAFVPPGCKVVEARETFTPTPKEVA